MLKEAVILPRKCGLCWWEKTETDPALYHTPRPGKILLFALTQLLWPFYKTMIHTNTEHFLKWVRSVEEKSWQLPAEGYSLSGYNIVRYKHMLICSVNLKRTKIKILWQCTESAVCGWTAECWQIIKAVP